MGLLIAFRVTLLSTALVLSASAQDQWKHHPPERSSGEPPVQRGRSAGALVDDARTALKLDQPDQAVLLLTSAKEQINAQTDRSLFTQVLYFRALAMFELGLLNESRSDLHELFQTEPNPAFDLSLARTSFATFFARIQDEAVVRLFLRNVPVHAHVYVDSERVRDAAMPLLLAPGSHRLTVSRDNGISTDVHLTLSPGASVLDLGSSSLLPADRAHTDIGPPPGSSSASLQLSHPTQWLVTHEHGRGMFRVRTVCYGLLSVDDERLTFVSLSDPPEQHSSLRAGIKSIQKKGLGRGYVRIQLTPGPDLIVGPDQGEPAQLAAQLRIVLNLR